MNPVTPKLSMFLLPDAYDAPVYAKDQPPYIPLPAIRTFDNVDRHGDVFGKLVTTWQPSDYEIEALKRGQPVTITLLCVNHAKPILPMRVEVGGSDLR